jgi:hypothetical protein
MSDDITPSDGNVWADLGVEHAAEYPSAAKAVARGDARLLRLLVLASCGAADRPVGSQEWCYTVTTLADDILLASA